MTLSAHKSLFATLALLCLASSSAQAQAPTPPAGKRLNIEPFIAEVDVNKDGCMSAEEWKKAGAPQSSYDMLNNNKGCVMADKMRATEGPPDIDLNGDGKLTLAEMKEFDKKMAPLMKQRAAAGASAPAK